ncbi:MAG: hypothetical protein ACK4UY_15095 [Dietzia sp.]
MSDEDRLGRAGRLPLTERDTFAIEIETASGSRYRITWHAQNHRGTLLRRTADSDDHRMSVALRRDSDVLRLIGFDRIDLGYPTTFVIDVRSDGVLTHRWANVTLHIEDTGRNLALAADPDDASDTFADPDPPGEDSDDLGLTWLSNGVLTNIHSPSACAGQPWGCWVHEPRPHPLDQAPVRWREDKGTAERICDHGVGHPDPQDAAYWWNTHRRDVTLHGCDGCCRPLPDWSTGTDTSAASTDVPSARSDI